LDLKCSNCGIPRRQEDLFCSKCGLRIRPSKVDPEPDEAFRQDLPALLKTLDEFRAWIDQSKKINVRFMKIYKQRIEDEIGPSIRQFKEKYGASEGGHSKQFELILETFASFKRPTALMETKLRPSVGIGIWQERWMMTRAVENYLKACCQEADRYINELKQNLASF
jgi:hypothetical protein